MSANRLLFICTTTSGNQHSWWFYWRMGRHVSHLFPVDTVTSQPKTPKTQLNNHNNTSEYKERPIISLLVLLLLPLLCRFKMLIRGGSVLLTHNYDLHRFPLLLPVPVEIMKSLFLMSAGRSLSLVLLQVSFHCHSSHDCWVFSACVIVGSTLQCAAPWGAC